MKISILTLRVDNNYGGHLQRYALFRILRDMGHDVTVLYFRSEWNSDGWAKRVKKTVKYFVNKLIGRPSVLFPYWKHEELNWEESRKYTYPFFEKYVKHTSLICNQNDLKRCVEKWNFDCYIVGSDQVWRKRYTQRWGIERFFLDFTPIEKKKIAYAASFGLPDIEYTYEEMTHLGMLYSMFTATSVREESGCQVLAKYGWTSPMAELVLDPTMLLPKEHYEQLVLQAETKPSNGSLFCYILDRNMEIDAKIDKLAKEKQLKSFYVSIEGDNRVSVEQWLRSFMDANYVITNSYHGVIFSLIFNKPFYIIENNNRGNARFASLMKMFGISYENNVLDWKNINAKLIAMRSHSFRFLENALI